MARPKGYGLPCTGDKGFTGDCRFLTTSPQITAHTAELKRSGDEAMLGGCRKEGPYEEPQTDTSYFWKNPCAEDGLRPGSRHGSEA